MTDQGINCCLRYIETAATNQPSAAIDDAATQITFSELRNWARRIARQMPPTLKSQPVASCLSKVAACVVSFLGITYGGNLYPVNSNGKIDRQRRVLECL